MSEETSRVATEPKKMSVRLSDKGNLLIDGEETSFKIELGKWYLIQITTGDNGKLECRSY